MYCTPVEYSSAYPALVMFHAYSSAATAAMPSSIGRAQPGCPSGDRHTAHHGRRRAAGSGHGDRGGAAVPAVASPDAISLPARLFS
jgi:hypothetical protein